MTNYKALVKQHGVKKASQMWKKMKKHSVKKHSVKKHGIKKKVVKK